MRKNQINVVLTSAELEQLACYVDARDKGVDSGWYYGDKEAFEKRHMRLRVLFGLTPAPPPSGGEG